MVVVIGERKRRVRSRNLGRNTMPLIGVKERVSSTEMIPCSDGGVEGVMIV